MQSLDLLPCASNAIFFPVDLLLQVFHLVEQATEHQRVLFACRQVAVPPTDAFKSSYFLTTPGFIC